MSNSTGTMKAAVIHTPGGPNAFNIEHVPIPAPKAGEVLVRVKAFGLNRSEFFTRQGHSPGVAFPRVLGIEGTGVVASAPGGEFTEGDVVATCMGGMGRDFDGSYAEYMCVKAARLKKVEGQVPPWETLGALPEMLQTAWGSLVKALALKQGDHLLIRGGTTSIGLAAAAIAKHYGATVSSTSRRADRETLVRSAGAKHFFVDKGTLAPDVLNRFPGGVDKVLELIGTATLDDSLQCARRPGGVVCMTGIVGNAWTVGADWNPMERIPTGVLLTSYGKEHWAETPFDELVRLAAEGALPIHVGKTFRLDQIVEAHECMDADAAGGKIVVLP